MHDLVCETLAKYFLQAWYMDANIRTPVKKDEVEMLANTIQTAVENWGYDWKQAHKENRAAAKA